MARRKYPLLYLDAVGGVRVEKTEQGYTLNTFYPTGINGINKTYTDILPSVNLKFKLNAEDQYPGHLLCRPFPDQIIMIWYLLPA